MDMRPFYPHRDAAGEARKTPHSQGSLARAARPAERATLDANYLLARGVQAGFEPVYAGRRENGVTSMDFARGLLDYGSHAYTQYVPQLVPEWLLIEPTETESQESLDASTTCRPPSIPISPGSRAHEIR
jgi:Glycine dehydrogenase, C-terminal domain